MKEKTVHFDIEGKWLTWFLRHLWIEGNEVKALNMWFKTFPDMTSLEIINEYFIPIVSGKKKFTGWGSGDGFGVEKDNQKYWDPDQSGKPSKSFPLIDSWHDVILYKKAKMYLAELELRTFRLNRRHPSTFEACQGNSVTWAQAVDENKIENPIRKEINQYWSDIRNLSNSFLQETTLQQLQTDELPLKTGPTALDKYNISTLQECYSAYQGILNYLHPIQLYFTKKYGSIHIYSDIQIRQICGLGEDDELTITQVKRRLKEKSEFVENVMSAEDKANHWSTKDSMTMALGLPMPDVNAFVNAMIKDGQRTSIDPEDVSKTEWQSGYIDLEGRFYGCSDLNHTNFSEDLCKKFGYKDDDDEKDAQVILDEKGFVKISLLRFFWDSSKKVTSEQKITIHDFMTGKKMFKALFNTTLPSQAKTFAEEFK